ncbi:hypothetical protein KBC79_07220 [Candidatus Woesebacteria bacterium]|nr:hypothetical protein [Candidatus Woesebacteria bacterium]
MSKKKRSNPPAVVTPLEVGMSEILNADIGLIRQDLLKTLGITVLLLIGIFGIFIYLG